MPRTSQTTSNPNRSTHVPKLFAHPFESTIRLGVVLELIVNSDMACSEQKRCRTDEHRKPEHFLTVIYGIRFSAHV